MNVFIAAVGSALVGALGPLTCLGGAEGVDDSAAQSAHQVWIQDCAHCHGMAGAGDGPAAVELVKPPPDFSDPCRRMSRAWVERVILSGGKDFGGSPEMEPHHELQQRPEVLRAMVDVIVAMAKSGERKPAKPPPVDVAD